MTSGRLAGVLPPQAQMQLDPEYEELNGPLSVQDERKHVWMKLQTLRDAYLNEMIELYGMLTARSNQSPWQRSNSKNLITTRMIPYLRVPQDQVPKEFSKEKVDAFEKQIVNIVETFKRRSQGAAQ